MSNTDAMQSKYQANDRVEIIGLEAEADASLNGQVAVVMQHDGTNSVQVCTASGEVRSLKLTNVAKLAFNPIDCVEVHGLTSDGGKSMNGLIGVVKEHVPGKGRYEVRLAGKLVNLRPENLKKINFAKGEAVAKPALQVWKPPADVEKPKQDSQAAKRRSTSKAAKAKLGAKASTALSTLAKTGAKRRSSSKAADGKLAAKASNEGSTPVAKGAAIGAAKKKVLASVAKSVLGKKGVRGKSAKVNKSQKDDNAVTAATSVKSSEPGNKIKRSTKAAPKKKSKASAEELPIAASSQPEEVSEKTEAAPKKRAKAAKATQKHGKAAAEAAEVTESSETAPNAGAESTAAGPAKKRARASKATPEKIAASTEAQAPSGGADQRSASPDASAGPAKKRGRTSNAAAKETVDTPAESTPQPKAALQEAEKDAEGTTSACKPTKTRARAAKKTEEKTDAPSAEAAVSEVATPAKSAQKKAPRNASKAAEKDGTADSDVLEKAEKLGYSGALQNLLKRDNITALGFPAEKLLAALEASDGLVNKAKDSLLGL